jgi:hypothetical protein
MLIFPSVLATENLENHFFFKILVFSFAFWRNFASKMKGWSFLPDVHGQTRRSPRASPARTMFSKTSVTKSLQKQSCRRTTNSTAN